MALAATAARTPPRQLADDAPHLLLVDDDRRIRDLLSRFLCGEGYRVTTAMSAKDARAKLLGLHFDLLILDVMMPGETGFDLARFIRASSSVPIIMLTARLEAESADRGPADRRRRLCRQTVRAARADPADRQYPQAHRAAAGGGAGADRVRPLRLSSRTRRTAQGRGDHPSHRSRARNAAHPGRGTRRDRAARMR